MAFTFPSCFDVTQVTAVTIGRTNGALIDITTGTGQELMTPIVGPTATLAAHRLLTHFAGDTCHLADLGALLGMPPSGKVLGRALQRLCTFRFATFDGTTLGVARQVAFTAHELGRWHPILADRYLDAARAA